MQIKPSLIPQEVRRVVETLEGTGYEAYIVGGCVRDLPQELRADGPGAREFRRHRRVAHAR